MMPILLGFKLLSLFGLSDRLAKKFAPLALAGMALLLVGLIVIGFNWWLAGEKREAVEADRNAASAEALSKARDADESAERAGNRTREGIEAKNERARDAAAGSDDPLREGLNELREAR